MRILLLAPHYDRNTPGESWSTFKWVEGISGFAEVTVLTQHKKGWDTQSSPTGAARVINWDEPEIPGMQGRISWELKPGYVWFYYRARKWIKQALAKGERFDLVHQINPLALRYPCPARGLGIKYIIGPLAGSLATPEAFRATTPERQWYRKLRSVDTLRLRYDPWLKSSYRGAAVILGVAPYVEELLAPCRPQRFEIMAETGVESVVAEPKSPPSSDRPLRFLFVGRIIRTKGIMEAIEAVALAAQRTNITFDIVGVGDMLEPAKALAARLDLNHIVTFHGRQPREEVFRWYDRSDVFLFPSYREPSGNVVFEAMSRGLPVITSDVGGPAHVVTNDCGYRVSTASRDTFIAGLSESIQDLNRNLNNFPSRSAHAVARMSQIASWPVKIQRLAKLYDEQAAFRVSSH